jgi:hypothetical protein
MARPVEVREGTVAFYAQVSETDDSDLQTIGLDEVMSLDGVQDTIEAIGSRLAMACKRVRPTEATVEFGLKLTARSGKLTGLLVEGGGEATLQVKMTWASA